MKRAKTFILGYGFGVLTLVACANVTYKYYGISMPDECYDKGTLLGKVGNDGWKDLPLTECKPDQSIKGKCVMQTTADFFNKEKDLQECQKALDACQRGPQPQLANE